jgi:hypothetical protein
MDRSLLTKQVSIFLENKTGRLADVCDLLGREGMNIRALCIADTSDFGILRLIVNDPDRATELLRAAGHSVGETDVLAVQIDDRPGGLAAVLNVLRPANVNVEYMYAFVTPLEGKAVVIFRVVDEMMQQTADILDAQGIAIVPAETIYSI